ncbi:helix-hairpin-helix domain-containing protein [Halococcus sp. IIIV-5B]|uniref:helix-hairpin-helix domain-containing protein n=1 Tax=Halococcus sp. IIIV-5B TaxID=2321230 RepID=UPI000E7104DE|nr:helix-hairpin-helix domain-containing protein [Halococcus sp. IIIV-5B]RJT03889.1 hypothetical protein D3261_10645 [Halococcus sp. IIIV-5B]
MATEELDIVIEIVDEFSDELDELAADLEGIDTLKEDVEDITIDVDVDGVDEAISQIESVHAVAEDFEDTYTADLDVDENGEVSSALRDIRGDVAEFEDDFSEMSLDLGDIDAELVEFASPELDEDALLGVELEDIPIESIDDIDERTSTALNSEGYKSLRDIREAPESELTDINGIEDSRAQIQSLKALAENFEDTYTAELQVDEDGKIHSVLRDMRSEVADFETDVNDISLDIGDIDSNLSEIEPPEFGEDALLGVELEDIPLEEVKGIGEHTSTALNNQGYENLSDIQQAEESDLTNVDGVGEKRASQFKEAARTLQVTAELEDDSLPIRTEGGVDESGFLGDTLADVAEIQNELADLDFDETLSNLDDLDIGQGISVNESLSDGIDVDPESVQDTLTDLRGSIEGVDRSEVDEEFVREQAGKATLAERGLTDLSTNLDTSELRSEILDVREDILGLADDDLQSEIRSQLTATENESTVLTEIPELLSDRSATLNADVDVSEAREQLDTLESRLDTLPDETDESTIHVVREQIERTRTELDEEIDTADLDTDSLSQSVRLMRSQLSELDEKAAETATNLDEALFDREATLHADIDTERAIDEIDALESRLRSQETFSVEPEFDNEALLSDLDDLRTQLQIESSDSSDILNEDLSDLRESLSTVESPSEGVEQVERFEERVEQSETLLESSGLDTDSIYQDISDLRRAIGEGDTIDVDLSSDVESGEIQDTIGRLEEQFESVDETSLTPEFDNVQHERLNTLIESESALQAPFSELDAGFRELDRDILSGMSGEDFDADALPELKGELDSLEEASTTADTDTDHASSKVTALREKLTQLDELVATPSIDAEDRSNVANLYTDIKGDYSELRSDVQSDLSIGSRGVDTGLERESFDDSFSLREQFKQELARFFGSGSDRDVDVPDRAEAFGVDPLDMSQNSPKKPLKKTKMTMSGLYGVVASLIPMLMVFIGAIPAAVAGLVTLAGAAVGAAGAIGGLTLLGGLGAAAERGGGYDTESLQQGFSSIKDDLREDFLQAFAPIADDLQPLFEDGVEGLGSLFDRIAARDDVFLQLEDEARAFGGFVLNYVPGLLASLAELGEAMSPLFAMFGEWLEGADIIEGFAHVAAEVLPALLPLIDAFLEMLPTLLALSTGFMQVSAIVFQFIAAIGSVIEILGPFGEFIGMGVAALLMLVTALSLATTVTSAFSGTLVATGFAALMTFVQGLAVSVGGLLGFSEATIMASTGVGVLTTAITALLAVTGIGILVALAGAVVGVGSGFMSASSDIDEATKSLKRFNAEADGFDGPNPYAPMSVGENVSQKGSAEEQAIEDENKQSSSSTSSTSSKSLSSLMGGSGSSGGTTINNNQTINAKDTEDAGRELSKQEWLNRNHSDRPV